MAQLPPHAPAQAAPDLCRQRTDNLFFGVHGSWAEAESAAREFGSVVGYDNEATVSLYEGRVRKDQHDYPSLYWIYRSMLEGHRSVFDIGGNIGIKYLAFKEALERWPDLVWRVQDVPAVIEHGRKLAQARGNGNELQFTDSFGGGDGIDVLFASGVLQYLPVTLGAILREYRALPKRIVINTTAIHAERDYFTVNSIGKAFCPYRVQTQASLIRGLTELGYRLRETWVNPDKPLLIPEHPALSLRNYCGYCLDLAA
jgi:putative methyltransferase (TIGR04325 family)